MNTPAIVDAFVEALVRVVRTTLGEEAELIATRYARDVDPPPSIVVAVELTGGLRGPITWSFSPELARKVADQMLMGAAAPEHYPDAVAELANMVLGNALSALEDAGYLVELAPPSIKRERRVGPAALVVEVASASGGMKLLLDVEAAA
jgi:CheY-specific phosphatase CheX